jgi:hypothetical protein
MVYPGPRRRRCSADRLGYDYLGNWIDRPDNANIEQNLLRAWLKNRGQTTVLIGRALHELPRWRPTPASTCMTATRPSMTCCATA